MNTSFINIIQDPLKISKDLIVTENQEQILHLLCKNCQILLQDEFLQCQKCENLICQNCSNKNNYNQYQCKLDPNCLHTQPPQQPELLIRKDVQKKLSNLQLRCFSTLNQSNQENICNQILTKKEFHNHVKQCPYILIQCTNNGCDVQVLRKNLNKHLEECSYGKGQCEYCKKEVVKRDLKLHERSCVQRELCQFCQEYQPKQIIEFHRQHCQKAQQNLKNANMMINLVMNNIDGLTISELKNKYQNTMEIIKQIMKQCQDDQKQEMEILEKMKNEKLKQLQTSKRDLLKEQMKNNQLLDENLQLQNQINQMNESQIIMQSQITPSTNNESFLKGSDSDLKKQGFTGNEEIDKIILTVFQQYDKTKKEQRQLRKQFLKEANFNCQAQNFWNNDWSKFASQCGEFVNEKTKQMYHDPLGLIFTNWCYNCYQVYQRYKTEESKANYKEDLEEFSSLLKNYGADLEKLIQWNKKNNQNTSSIRSHKDSTSSNLNNNNGFVSNIL